MPGAFAPGAPTFDLPVFPSRGDQAELANGFGNLASRVIAMVNRYYDGVIPAPAEYLDVDVKIQSTLAIAYIQADAAMKRLAIDEAIAAGLNDHAAVPAAVNTCWRRHRVEVSHLAGHLAPNQPARRLEVHQAHHGLQQRGVHPLATA